MSIKLAIVSNSRLLYEGLRRLIEDDDGIAIVGTAEQSMDLERLSQIRPDVVLTDHHTLYHIPRHYLSNGLKFVLIDNRTQPSLIDGEIIELISKGVIAGILSADTNGDLLKKAVKLVSTGELWLGHMTIKNILSHSLLLRQNLTRQESEIANLILKGLCNKEIARELKITEATVKSHCNRLFKKFNVSGRLQLGLKLKSMTLS